jgi:hypothetical protein
MQGLVAGRHLLRRDDGRVLALLGLGAHSKYVDQKWMEGVISKLFSPFPRKNDKSRLLAINFIQPMSVTLIKLLERA